MTTAHETWLLVPHPNVIHISEKTTINFKTYRFFPMEILLKRFSRWFNVTKDQDISTSMMSDAANQILVINEIAGHTPLAKCAQSVATLRPVLTHPARKKTSKLPLPWLYIHFICYSGQRDDSSWDFLDPILASEMCAAVSINHVTERLDMGESS